MFERIQTMLADYFGVPADSITPETEFVKDLKADSLAIVELMYDLESETGKAMGDDIMDKVKSVGDLVNYLENASQKPIHKNGRTASVFYCALHIKIRSLPFVTEQTLFLSFTLYYYLLINKNY